MISAISLRSTLVKDFWSVCLFGLFLLPAAAVAARSPPLLAQTPLPLHPAVTVTPRPAACPSRPTDSVAWPCRACQGGHLTPQWCSDPKQKTHPPASPLGSGQGKGPPRAHRTAGSRRPCKPSLSRCPHSCRVPSSAPSPRCRLPRAGLTCPPKPPAAPRAPRPSPDPHTAPAPAAARRAAPHRPPGPAPGS